MSRSKKSQKKHKQTPEAALIRVGIVVLFFVCAGGFSLFHFVFANTTETLAFTTNAEIDPNFSIKTRTIQFLEDNNASALIPVIKCESHFQHYENDGTTLKNREGSSAIGVAQILSSQHPDPKVIYVYNRRNNTDFTVNDFDLNTFEGNIGYALVLFKVRGTKDWECAHKYW